MRTKIMKQNTGQNQRSIITLTRFQSYSQGWKGGELHDKKNAVGHEAIE